MKYYLVEINENNCEIVYVYKTVIRAESEQELALKIESLVTYDSDLQYDEINHACNIGDFRISYLESLTEITKEEYKILAKYI